MLLVRKHENKLVQTLEKQLLSPGGYKDEFQGWTSRNIYLIKFKTFQAIGNPVNTTKQGLDAGWFKFFPG